MPSSHKRIVDCASVGNPPKKKMVRNVETVKFVIHGFEDNKEQLIESTVLKAHGYDWRIILHPKMQSNRSIYVSCYLVNLDVKVTATVTFWCKGYQKERTLVAGADRCGFSNYLERDDVKENYLDEYGTFVIGIDIEMDNGGKRVWYPRTLQKQNTLIELYEDESSETSDVIFSVGGTMIRAHKSVLIRRGEKLYEIAKECNDIDEPIPIDSVRAEIFKSILEFVYTVKMPSIETEVIATELLCAADRFECVDLKLYIESIVVDKFITAGNAAAMLIFADSHSCALIKESAIDLFITDTASVKKAEAWSQIEESKELLLGLLNSMVCSNKIMGRKDVSEFDRMNVEELRNELEAADLELDGSREVLVDRLKTLRQYEIESSDSNSN